MKTYDVFEIYDFVFSADTREEAEAWIAAQEDPWKYEIEENDYEVDWDYDGDLEMGFNPYEGCYDFDC